MRLDGDRADIPLLGLEDGFEIDKWLMTTDRNYTPEGTGPAPRVASGRLRFSTDVHAACAAEVLP